MNSFPSPAASDEILPAPSPGHEKVYRAGTLRYTARGLVVLSLWLLAGDFAFTFFEAVFGRFMPLYLKDLHASNTLIGVMTGSFAGVVNILFLPNISQWSDHTRTRWGRRIPFLSVVAPLTVLALVSVGFAPEIARFLFPLLAAHGLLVHPSQSGLVLGLLCVFVVAYHFFNMVLVNAYNWLLRDVVPLELMARFLSWFRIVGTAATVAFLWFVFPHLTLHRREIFLGVGLFYTAAFLLMCFRVKEGDYPPPPPPAERAGLVASFRLYFKECLSEPLYRNFFLASVLAIAATACAGPFSILFTRETLGLDMRAMGRIFAWGAAVSVVVYFPMGWLCDRVGPLRVALGALCGLAAASVAAFFLVTSPERYFAYTLVWAFPSVAWGLGSLASAMRLFPEDKFGQFSSAINVFGCGALIVGNFLIGKFIDLVKGDYRMTFLWSATLFALAVPPMIRVCRAGRRNGIQSGSKDSE